jgi:hypothetical protein
VITIWFLYVFAVAAVLALFVTAGGRRLLACSFDRLAKPRHRRRYLRPHPILVQAVHNNPGTDRQRAERTRDALASLVFKLGEQGVDATVMAGAILACRQLEQGVILSVVDGVLPQIDPNHPGAGYLLRISDRVHHAAKARL